MPDFMEIYVEPKENPWATKTGHSKDITESVYVELTDVEEESQSEGQCISESQPNSSSNAHSKINCACNGKCLCFVAVGSAASAACGAGAAIGGTWLAKIIGISSYTDSVLNLAVNGAEYAAAAGACLHSLRGIFTTWAEPELSFTASCKPTHTCVLATGVSACAGLPFYVAATTESLPLATQAAISSSVGGAGLTMPVIIGQYGRSIAIKAIACVSKTIHGVCR